MITLSVLFQDPFWVGIFEETEGRKLRAARVVFGAEPTDAAVYEFILTSYQKIRFSKPVHAAPTVIRVSNPKRMQREIARTTKQVSVGANAQQAIKILQETTKIEKKAFSKEKTLLEEERCFVLRQEKKKSRHRGH
jgi:hypothetical protein